MNIVENKSADEKLKNLTLIIYILYLASVFIGVTALAAIIINYLKKDDVAGTLYESHFRWQMRTFWFGILWVVIGAITAVFFYWFPYSYRNRNLAVVPHDSRLACAK